jgi:hypothetical protein
MQRAEGDRQDDQHQRADRHSHLPVRDVRENRTDHDAEDDSRRDNTQARQQEEDRTQDLERAPTYKNHAEYPNGANSATIIGADSNFAMPAPAKARARITTRTHTAIVRVFISLPYDYR